MYNLYRNFSVKFTVFMTEEELNILKLFINENFKV